MAYQVLARKWRPKTFKDLVGQDHVATTLINALKNDRLPHALLFTGARGVGKTSTARILAKSLRCPNAKEFVPCNECSECNDIAQGVSLNVLEIDGASNNSVDNIRELRDTVSFMPSSGKYKVYIIDEVHMLSQSAFNALLKTLEEPPAHVIFIFATTEVQKIPVTILSRCQRFDLRRIPIKQTADALDRICKAEGVTADSQVLWLIAKESEGSLRDGLSLLDQVISFAQGDLSVARVVEVLGLTDRALLGETLRAVISRDVKGCLTVIEKIFSHGYDSKVFIQDLLEQIRNLMIVKIIEDSRKDAGSESQAVHGFLDLPDQEVVELQGLAGSLSGDDIHLLFDMTLKGATEVLRSQDPRLVLEMLLLRLSQAPNLVDLQKLISALESGGGGGFSERPVLNPRGNMNPVNKSGVRTESVAPRPATPSMNAPSGATAVPHVTPQILNGLDSRDRWVAILGVMKKEKPLLGAKLEYAFVKSFDNGKLELGFRKENEFIFSQISQTETMKTIKDFLNRLLEKPTEVVVAIMAPEVKTSSVAVESVQNEVQRVKTETDQALRDKVEGHPVVQKAMKLFNAKVTNIKELEI